MRDRSLPRKPALAIGCAAVVLGVPAAFALSGGSKDEARPAPPTYVEPQPQPEPHVIFEPPPQPYQLPSELPADDSGGGYVEQTPGGYIGGDGTTSYYSDPETGCSVIPGDGVSC